MKKCLDCNSDVDDNAYVCPKCGGGTLMGSYSAEDALSMLDGMQDMEKGREHVDQSATLFRQGRLEEAKTELKKALKIAPNNPTAHGNMGALLLQQGKHAEAIPWLEKALALNPNLEGIPQALAQAKAAKQNKTESSGCFIATACYPDPDCRQIQVLRQYRDLHLTGSATGRLFIRIYYTCSPLIARWLATRNNLRSIVRKCILNPIVNWIENKHGK